MHHLSIDLETYSSVPIAKAGAQKYISSPDFEILLFAYSVDGAPVEIIDLARGERLPPWLVQAITSYNNNYGLRRGSQPRLFPSQSRSC